MAPFLLDFLRTETPGVQAASESFKLDLSNLCRIIAVSSEGAEGVGQVANIKRAMTTVGGSGGPRAYMGIVNYDKSWGSDNLEPTRQESVEYWTRQCNIKH